MDVCLERSADLHMAQLMPLPLTVSCFSKIQIGFTFLVPAHPGSPGQRAVKRVCVCVYVSTLILTECWAQAQKGLGSNHTFSQSQKHPTATIQTQISVIQSQTQQQQSHSTVVST